MSPEERSRTDTPSDREDTDHGLEDTDPERRVSRPRDQVDGPTWGDPGKTSNLSVPRDASVRGVTPAPTSLDAESPTYQ